VKLKITNHKLHIEIGRYNKFSTRDRLCTLYSLNVEDEINFPIRCP